jgi:hypothetical protein
MALQGRCKDDEKVKAEKRKMKNGVVVPSSSIL